MSLSGQGKMSRVKRGKHPKPEHSSRGAIQPANGIPPQDMDTDMMKKSQESRPAKRPRKKRASKPKNDKAETRDATVLSATQNVIGTNGDQLVRDIPHQEQTWNFSEIAAEQGGVATQSDTRLPTSQSEPHKEENSAKQYKSRKNKRHNKKEKFTAEGSADVELESLTTEESSKLFLSDLLETEFGNRAKVLGALRSASPTSPTPTNSKNLQLPSPSYSPAPRRRKGFEAFSADHSPSENYRSNRGWLTKEERKHMGKTLKANERSQLYLAPHLRHSAYIKRQLQSPSTIPTPKSPQLVDANGRMDPDAWARENGWADDSRPFGTSYEQSDTILKRASSDITSKRDAVITSLQLQTSPDQEQWNGQGRSKWVRLKIPKASPLKPDSDAWGSDTEHGAASAHPSQHPEADVRQLVDWEGNWLPAPIDWEVRRGYRNQNLFSSLDTWMIKTEEAGGNVTIDVTAEPLFLDTKNGEIAARCWIPDTIDGQAPQTWWKPYLTTKVAVEEGVDPETKPWWTLYITNQSNVLTPWEAPDAKLDPTDENYGRSQQDLGSHSACQREQWKDNRKKERKALAKAPSAKLAEFKKANGYKEQDPGIVPPDGDKEPIRTRINMYLRPAYEVDAQQIVEIYNWHIERTCHLPDFKPYTVGQIKEKLAGIKNAMLPALVAVEKSTQKNNPHLRRQNRAAYPPPLEQIIGIAWADDYHAMTDSAYRYTADVELYVRPDFRQRGVANCLLDKLLFCLNPDHKCRGGYEWATDNYIYAGGDRVIGKVLCHLPYETHQQDRLVFLDRWLGQHGFRKVGDIPDIGMKNGKWISTAIFHLTTGSTLNPVTAL